jgi:N-acetylmuramoyl-L-alanine amidase
MSVIRGILALLILAGLSSPAWGKASVTDARLGLDAGATRVVLNLTDRAEYRIFALADPARVVIDLDEVDWAIPSGQKLKGRGLVAAMRYGLFQAGTSRIVLDLSGPAKVAQARYLPPENGESLRLLIDLVPTKEAEFRNNLKTSVIASSDKAPLPLPEIRTASGSAGDEATAGQPRKPLIVIDPGHGGVDPGAIGDDAMEKEITLTVARTLRDELLASGKFRVVLTRTKDVFIPLRERFQVAREDQADLFISLHADSHDDPKMRGASVYTLSETASDAEAEALAAKENKADIIAGVDLSRQSATVTDILIDLAQRDTTNLSARFAKILVKELKNNTLTLGKSHRYAGFAVLKAPDVPSVLLEMGYISSDKDKALLTSQKHQNRLARAIAAAIEHYFEWHEMVRRS